jgi:hypothetical protein
MKNVTMLAVAAIPSAATAAHADSLPMERGYYVGATPLSAGVERHNNTL